MRHNHVFDEIPLLGTRLIRYRHDDYAAQVTSLPSLSLLGCYISTLVFHCTGTENTLALKTENMV